MGAAAHRRAEPGRLTFTPPGERPRPLVRSPHAIGQNAGRGVDRCDRDLAAVVVAAHTGRRDARVMAQRHGVLTGQVTVIADDTFQIVEHGTPITVHWADPVAAELD